MHELKQQVKSHLIHSYSDMSDMIVKAFKMACLSYEPSQINWNQRLFTREDLIRKRVEDLEKAVKSDDFSRLKLEK